MNYEKFMMIYITCMHHELIVSYMPHTHSEREVFNAKYILDLECEITK